MSWAPNTEQDLAGYKVYYSTSSGSYTNVVDVGLTVTPNSPTFLVSDLTEGSTYYFSVTAYDGSLNQSGFSKEAWTTITAAGADTTPSGSNGTSTDTAADDPPPFGDGTTGSLIPVSNAGINQIVETGDHVTLDGSMSFDPDGHPLSYEWTQTGGTPINIENQKTPAPKFYPVDTGTYTFELVVDDGYAQSEAQQVKVYVMDRILTRQLVKPESSGTLSISSGDLDGVRLIIPAGAVEQDTEIAIGLDFSLPATDGRKRIGEAASFEPAGTRFAKPASVVFPIDLNQFSNPDDIKAFLYDEPTGQWNPVPIVNIDQENGLVTANIDHFSSFALTAGDTPGHSNSDIQGGFGCGAITDVNGRGGNSSPPSLDFLLLGGLLIWFPLMSALRSKAPIFAGIMARIEFHEIPGFNQPGIFVMLNRPQFRA